MIYRRLTKSSNRRRSNAMMKWVSYREISDIERDQRYSAVQTNDVTRRQLVPIAVIDDEPFPPQPTLQNNGYNINVLGDIKKIYEVEPYRSEERRVGKECVSTCRSR